jgi:hypothetical protein
VPRLNWSADPVRVLCPARVLLVELSRPRRTAAPPPMGATAGTLPHRGPVTGPRRALPRHPEQRLFNVPRSHWQAFTYVYFGEARGRRLPSLLAPKSGSISSRTCS